MGIIRGKTVAYRFGHESDPEIVCRNCIEEDELKNLRGEEIITDQEIQEAREYDGRFFCDRGGKEIYGPLYEGCPRDENEDEK